MIITKEISLACAHRLTNYVGPCANIHGHNYRVLVSVGGDHDVIAENNGMVKDFRFLKEDMMNLIHAGYDHALVINRDDQELLDFVLASGMTHVRFPSNATAENMAREFFCIMSNAGYKVESVTVYETETSYAVYSCDDFVIEASK